MIAADMLLQQKQIYNFLRTVTIKYEPIAQYVNNALLEKGYSVNFNDPTTWKYYINMIGEYHISDTRMYVMSLDTREQILFDKDILITNPRTRAAYSPGGVYYNKLCSIYPDQVDLIKSILFPVESIEKAITSADFTLLNYANGYLEIYEEKIIIMEIEKFLEIYVERWYFDFLSDEPYFYLTVWGSLWTFLAMLIMSLRLEYIKTPYVHSWHLWNELKTKGLNNYSDILDRKKSMMLYQNIDYLKNNAGKQSNLIILANNLLADIGIGIYGRKVVQESETGESSYQLTPQMVPAKIPTDYGTLVTEIVTVPVQTIQSQIYEKGLTRSDSAEVVSVIERKLGDTTLNNYMTKFLEIRPLARNLQYKSLMSNFLLETLVVSIKEGYYSKAIEVAEPITNTILYLFPSELLALYNYAIQKSLGIDNDVIPSNIYLYQSFLPNLETPSPKFKQGTETFWVSQQIDSVEFFSGLNYDQNIQNPDEFSTNATALWLRYLTHHISDQNTVLEKRHVILDYLTKYCHKHREETLVLVPGYTSYSQWLGSDGIDIITNVLSQYDSQFDPKEAWSTFADIIMASLVPTNEIMKVFGNFTLSSSGYKRLQELFVQLCSYRVVFLESQRDSDEINVGAKWSTKYGPDSTLSTAKGTVGISSATSDTSIVNNILSMHGGVSVERVSTIEAFEKYTLSSVTNMSQTVVSQEMHKPHFTIREPSSVMSHGMLNFVHSPTTAVLD